MTNDDTRQSWRAYVAKVCAGEVDLPKPWTYPKDQLVRRRPSPYQFFDYGKDDVGRPLWDAPVYAYWYTGRNGDPAHSEDVLLLAHPAVVLPPGYGEDEGYELGPFNIGIVFWDDGYRRPTLVFQVFHQDGGAVEDVYNAHPNTSPSPCYGAGDTGYMLEACTAEQDWESALFTISRYLATWNPDDYPTGHPKELCTRRVPWTGPTVNDEPPGANCSRCGDRVPEGNVRYDDHGEAYCPSCYREMYVSCYYCGDEMHLDEGDFTWVHDDAVCYDCYATRYYACRECEGHQRKGRADDPKQDYCNDCFDRLLSYCDGESWGLGDCTNRFRTENVKDPEHELCDDCYARIRFQCSQCHLLYDERNMYIVEPEVRPRRCDDCIANREPTGEQPPPPPIKCVVCGLEVGTPLSGEYKDSLGTSRCVFCHLRHVEHAIATEAPSSTYSYATYATDTTGGITVHAGE